MSGFTRIESRLRRRVQPHAPDAIGSSSRPDKFCLVWPEKQDGGTGKNLKGTKKLVKAEG